MPVDEAVTVQINQHIENMRLDGRKQATLETVQARLFLIARQCNITDPEAAKQFLASCTWQQNTKHNAVIDLNGFYNFIGKQWKKPKYQRQEKLVYIPTEQEVDQLIAASNKNLAPLLQFLKETGARIGEACMLRWVDIDLEQRMVSIADPEKGSLPRNVPIGEKLKAMLSILPRTEKPVFLATTTQHGLRTNFEAMRERTAIKLGNPKLLKIHFHTFRHFKATVTMQAMGDSAYVRAILGHKTSHMTDLYMRQALTQTYDNNVWTSKAATTKEEIMQLIDLGFTKADEIDGIHIYRKRK